MWKKHSKWGYFGKAAENLKKVSAAKEGLVWLDSWMFYYTRYKSLGARELEDGRRKKARPNPCAAAEHSGQIKRDTTLHKS